MAYGLMGLQNSMENQAMRGFSDLSQQQQQQERADDALEQAEDGQTMAAVGTGAGFGMMAGGPVGAAIGAGVGLLASKIF